MAFWMYKDKWMMFFRMWKIYVFCTWLKIIWCLTWKTNRFNLIFRFLKCCIEPGFTCIFIPTQWRLEGLFFGFFRLNSFGKFNLLYQKNYIYKRLNYQIIIYLFGCCEFRILQLWKSMLLQLLKSHLKAKSWLPSS